ncbi:MAG: hypothetical protein WAX77_15565 [Methylococcaceae bacterium]
MTSHPQLHKVKQFKPKKIGECARKTFFSIMLFSLLGAISVVALSYWIFVLVGDDVIMTTSSLLVWFGTGIGVFYGSSKGAGCNNNKSFLRAITPVSLFLIIILFIRAYFTFRDGFDENDFFFIVEIIAILSTPIGLYWLYTNQFYCHHCKKNYQSIQLFASKTTSPYKILSLLNNKQIFPHVFDLEKDNSFPLY